MQDIALEVALQPVARVRNVVHQHLLELIEHLALESAQSDQRQNVLQRRRRRFVPNAPLQLRETVRVERQQHVLLLKSAHPLPPTRTETPPGAFRPSRRRPPAVPCSTACGSWLPRGRGTPAAARGSWPSWRTSRGSRCAGFPSLTADLPRARALYPRLSAGTGRARAPPASGGSAARRAEAGR